jgi:hypothetical protein
MPVEGRLMRLRMVPVWCAAVFVLLPVASSARLTLGFESGVVSAGYNDVRIPGDTGTLFSLSEDLAIDPSAFLRVRVGYTFGDRHTITALFAPLSVEATGTLGQDVSFAGEDFPAGTNVEGTYTFNSYRLTYRYEFEPSGNLDWGIGFTAKIRDAAIRVAGEGLEAEKTNVGFVPLLNFRARWHLGDRASLLLVGDALAAPQGRAEDVLAAVLYELSDNVEVYLGYRIVEGGADNDEVYNFALLNYASLGVTASF